MSDDLSIKMRTTMDMQSRKAFRWNTTVCHRNDDGSHTFVPARCTSQSLTHLHPSRVPAKLLAELNPLRVVNAAPDMLAALVEAEGFILGFEDDEQQGESVNPMLARIRAAITKAIG
jgi:hypothetical protein